MKNFKIFLITLTAFLFVIISIISCNYNDNKNNSVSHIKDRAGNEITIPERIDKIICLSPSITEILIDIGDADKIISVDSYSKEIFEKNNIDSSEMQIFDMMNPDAEKIISLNPNILFINNFSVFSGKSSIDLIKNLGLSVAVIPNSDTLAGIEDDISFIGKVLKLENNAEEIIFEMKENIEKIKSIGDKIKIEGNQKTVYFEIGATPNLYSFGTNVYLDDMINIIGAKNIFENRNSWIAVSEESVLSANPDIIFTSVDYIDNPVSEILNRKAWQNIKAIQKKQVYFIASSSLPNHNIIKALFLMAKSIYPNEYQGLFKSFNE